MIYTFLVADAVLISKTKQMLRLYLLHTNLCINCVKQNHGFRLDIVDWKKVLKHTFINCIFIFILEVTNDFKFEFKNDFNSPKKQI